MVFAMLALMALLTAGPQYAPELVNPIYEDYTVSTIVLFIEGGGFWTIATA